MKIAFVGLGQMGRPMALNLRKSGAEIIVSSRSDRLFAEMREKGTRPASDLNEIAAADVIITCLPGTESVRAYLLGDDGLLSKLRAGQTVIDTSTISYGAALEIAKQLEAKGVDFLDAPISGMEKRAIDGTLTIMCGGKREVFDAVKPILETMGNNILYMGGTGAGQLTKLINNLLFDINCAALAEIMPVATKLGLDSETMANVVNSGTGRSYASEFFLPRILKNGFSAGYPMQDAYKDLVNGAELGVNLGVPMPVLAAATATYQTALLKGHGAKDKGAMILVFEELLGVAFREAAAGSKK